MKRTTKIKNEDKQDKQESSTKSQDKRAKKDQKPRTKPTKQLQSKKNTTKDDQSDRNESIIRRSNRIKSISVQKQKSKGHGLVKGKKDSSEPDDINNSLTYEKNNEVLFPVPKMDVDHKPVKVKSRWRRSSELEMYQNSSRSNSPMIMDVVNVTNINTIDDIKKKTDQEEVLKRLKQFIHIKENHYLTERMSCKEAKKMTCDCFLTQEEIDRKEYGCGDDCLNRLLMIEWYVNFFFLLLLLTFGIVVIYEFNFFQWFTLFSRRSMYKQTISERTVCAMRSFQDGQERSRYKGGGKYPLVSDRSTLINR